MSTADKFLQMFLAIAGFAAFFALGVVILSRQGGFRQDLGSLLFGNILGVSTTDVWVTLVVALIVGGILLGLLKEFTLTAVGDASGGKAHAWKGSHAALVADPLNGRIRVNIGGKDFQSPLEPVGHDH